MTRIWKFVAVVASIAVFAMPAATLSLHCVLMPPLGDNPHHQCRMMAMNSSADQIKTAPSGRSCCEVSAAKPESMTVPQSPSGKGILAPPTTNALSTDLPAAPVLHELLDRTALLTGGPPLAVLCTFLI
jgi:hypothetical protein